MITRSLTLVLPNGQTSAGYEQQFTEGYRADRYPYGAENLPDPWRLRFSEERPRAGRRSPLARLALRLSGFDLAGGWARRRDLDGADVLYGHTEQEWVPVAFALLVTRNRSATLVAQTVWLFDGFSRLPRRRRWLMRRLASRVDVFVHNSVENESVARKLFSRGRHEYVPFGVSRRYLDASPREPRRMILSVGGDRARDWATLDDALRPLSGVEVRIASDSTFPGFDYAQVGRTRSIAELRALHRAAACMVITAVPNGHASGITAILEATASGTPVIATEDPGLQAYFPEGGITFVPRDSAAVRAAVEEFLADPGVARRVGDRAREAWIDRQYDNASYWARVIALLERESEGRGSGRLTVV